ncbi:MAG TPA: hypothetical protein VHK90_03105 [Thermoanaerobaculia bacterium]|nr:hypothetical protein [Thermoanaerobaculia bacterium]
MLRVLFLLLAATPALAGVVYDFVTTVETSRFTESVQGRVWAEGEAYRAELQRGGKTQVVISRDADENVTFVDPEKQTWSNRSRVGTVLSSSLFLWPVTRSRLAGPPQIAHSRRAAVEIAGRQAVPHTIDVSFAVKGDMGADGTYHVTVRVWSVEDLPPLPMKSELRTGYAAVDTRLRPIFAEIKGMVVRHELEVTRTLAGGPPQTERTVTKVTRLEQQPVPPAQFEVPATFTYAGPVAAK